MKSINKTSTIKSTLVADLLKLLTLGIPGAAQAETLVCNAQELIDRLTQKKPGSGQELKYTHQSDAGRRAIASFLSRCKKIIGTSLTEQDVLSILDDFEREYYIGERLTKGLIPAFEKLQNAKMVKSVEDFDDQSRGLRKDYWCTGRHLVDSFMKIGHGRDPHSGHEWYVRITTATASARDEKDLRAWVSGCPIEGPIDYKALEEMLQQISKIRVRSRPPGGTRSADQLVSLSEQKGATCFYDKASQTIRRYIELFGSPNSWNIPTETASEVPKCDFVFGDEDRTRRRSSGTFLNY